MVERTTTTSTTEGAGAGGARVRQEEGRWVGGGAVLTCEHEDSVAAEEQARRRGLIGLVGCEVFHGVEHGWEVVHEVVGTAS